MILKTQYSLLVSTDSLDYARNKIDTRFETDEDPESDQLKQLMESIKKDGILYPLLIRPKSKERYEVIAGNRRLAAAKALRLEYVPAIVKELDDPQARRIAFVENAIRKEVNAMQKAKGIAAMYEDAGIDRKIAIMKVKHMHNLRMDNRQEYDRLLAGQPAKNLKNTSSNQTIDPSKPTAEFLQVFTDIPLAANTQYQLLQTIIQIPETVQKILEKSPKLSTDKAVLLTHSKLNDYPEVVREELAHQIVDKNMPINKARTMVAQRIADLESGSTYVTSEGNISGLRNSTTDPTESVTADQELEKTFDVEILDITDLLMKSIGKILHIQRSRGTIRFEPQLYKPALQTFEKNLHSLKKSDKMFCAEQAAIMGRICKAIVDSVR